jgi:hypothetical protein
MIPAGISELEGKSIEKVEVYSDAVLIALADGKTAVAVFRVGDEFRVESEKPRPGGRARPRGACLSRTVPLPSSSRLRAPALAPRPPGGLPRRGFSALSFPLRQSKEPCNLCPKNPC